MRSTDPFARWGAFIYRVRWPVLVIWLVVLGVCGVLAPKASHVLKTTGIDAPKSDSGVASRILSEKFNVSALNNTFVVFRSDQLTVDNARFRRAVDRAAERVARAKGVTEVITYYDSRIAQLVSRDRHTTIMLAALKGDQGETQTYVDGVRHSLDGVTLEHYVTGNPAILRDFTKTSDKDLRRAEMFTFALVLLLLLLAFRTVVSAAVPLVLGAAAVVAATAVIYVIGSVTDTSIFALNVASMIGLGLAIDFSLIVVSRFREELAAGRDPESASAVTMATAGRSIVFSGVTVMLGMLVLTLLVDLVGVRSISLGVLLVAATAVLAGVTLLPALLGVLGHRLERLRVIPKGPPKPEREGFWYRFSRTIMRRPLAWLLASLAVLLVLAWPAHNLKMLGSTAEIIPGSTESVKGVKILDAEFGKNVLSPIQIVLTTPKKDGVFTKKFLDGLDKLSNTLAADPRASSVQSLATYMAPAPRDGRYEHLKPVYDFWPAPKLTNLKPGELAQGFFVRHFIDVWVPKGPQNPAFFGFGMFRFESGVVHRLRVTPTLQVYRPLTGRLNVRAGRTLTIWRKANFRRRFKGEQVAAGTQVTLNPGDQLVIPKLTPVTVGAAGGPAQMIAVVAFNVRPGVQPQDNWLEANPTADPFTGVMRKVIGGGLGMTFAKGETEIKLDEFRDDPHVRLPRHFHHGPEMIVVKSGTFTVFESPEMVVTAPNGRAVDAPYDTPLPLTRGGKGVVQGFGVHRSWNHQGVYAKIWSLRMIDANAPDITLVGVREIAKSFVNLDGGGDTTVINVVPRFSPYDHRQEEFVTAIRNLIIPSISGIAGAKAYVGGPTANLIDFRSDLYGKFPYLVGAVLLLTFLLLMMFFQSVFLPLKAIVLNICSILATYGVLVLIFQHGWGSGLFHFQPVNAITVITPAILFVILFSLSTDYEVFMLSRVKEYYEQTHDNEEAVAAGLQRTGGIITTAGLILIGVFGSFATAGIITIKEIGLGLAIGILIDTVIVRTIMVPATMRLAGDINWWMPVWLKRIVPKLGEGPVGEIGLAPATAVPERERIAVEEQTAE